MFFIQVVLDTPLRRVFDYLPLPDKPHSQWTPGLRVQVPFRNKSVVGMVVGVSQHTDVPLKRLKVIEEVLETKPTWSHDDLDFLTWSANYYHHSLGEVLLGTLPVLLRQLREKTKKSRKSKVIKEPNLETIEPEKQWLLNDEQQSALDQILSAQYQFNVFLLEGITGSGKTEVYLQACERILQAQKQVLILVPEIGLTPQLALQFKQRFQVPIAMLHSGLNDRQRLDAWLDAKEGRANIIIGTRSAVFTPIPQLGLIIVDEEHDLSFKQQDSFRYSARDLAVLRAHRQNIPIILGSATPSLETLQSALQGRYQHLILSKRAGNAVLPSFRLIDLKKQTLKEGLSTDLLEQMQKHLEAGNQVLLFINRRGFAPVLICHLCGWLSDCKACDAHMTLHHEPYHLHCHHCDATRSVPRECPECRGLQLLPVGLGTERVERVLQDHFKDYTLARIDKDTTRRRGELEDRLNEAKKGKQQILIGTQMLAKGHHFPDVTLVGILDADAGLMSADFRASERMGQLMMQVAGRAGRAEKPGEVLIQTHFPENDQLNQLLKHGYSAYARSLLAERQAAQWPPFTSLALFRAEASIKKTAHDFLAMIRKMADMTTIKKVKILGPIPALMERRLGRYRMQLLIHAQERKALHGLLDEILAELEKRPPNRQIRWSLEVDPVLS